MRSSAVTTWAATACRCLSRTTTSGGQPRFTDRDVEQLQTAVTQYAMAHLIAHSSYLINLATPDKRLWKKSLDAFVVELQRADRLQIPYVVLHPGAYTTSSEEAGLRQVIAALNEVHRQTRGLRAMCLLENTAGQGTCLGCRFEQLATLLDGVQAPERLGVCFDTCHAFAAGYPLAAESEYRRTMRATPATGGARTDQSDSSERQQARAWGPAWIGTNTLGAGKSASRPSAICSTTVDSAACPCTWRHPRETTPRARNRGT